MGVGPSMFSNTPDQSPPFLGPTPPDQQQQSLGYHVECIMRIVGADGQVDQEEQAALLTLGQFFQQLMQKQQAQGGQPGMPPMPGSNVPQPSNTEPYGASAGAVPKQLGYRGA